MFAVDSVPVIFAITTDPFIVYSSNIFAILGLRALYFALAAMIHRFKYLKYLKYALALVLVSIGTKIFLVGFLGKLPPAMSLAVTFGLIADDVASSDGDGMTHRMSHVRRPPFRRLRQVTQELGGEGRQAPALGEQD